MEQLIHTFGIDWKILLAQVVNFAVLLGVLWYFLYQPLLSFIEARREKIIQGVADAERAETALKDADAKKSDIIANASIEAEHIIATARETGKSKEADLVQEGQRKYDRLLQEATLKGEELEREALERSKEEIARLIVLGVEKTLRQSRTQ